MKLSAKIEECQEGKAAHGANSHGQVDPGGFGRSSCLLRRLLRDDPNSLWFGELAGSLQSPNQKGLQDLVGIFGVSNVLVCGSGVCSGDIIQKICSARVVADILCDVVD